jgi:hypothetical protein
MPIKCIEAVFLGLLLTSGWQELQRVPIGFKSCAGNGQVRKPWQMDHRTLHKLGIWTDLVCFLAMLGHGQAWIQ